MCNTLRDSLIKILEELDYSFRISKERKSKYYIKSIHKRTILTIFGEITYSRTFYTSKLDSKSFCYVDRLLDSKKYNYFDLYIKAEILDYILSFKYSETTEHIAII